MEKEAVSDQDLIVHPAINITVLEALSGSAMAIGTQEYEGIKLAHDLYPSLKIGEDEYPIELTLLDNQSQVTHAKDQILELIRQDDSSFLLGTADEAIATSIEDLINTAKIPSLVAASSLASILPESYYYSLAPDGEYEGKILALYARNELKTTHVLILRNTDDLRSTEIVKGFMDNIQIKMPPETKSTSIPKKNQKKKSVTKQIIPNSALIKVTILDHNNSDTDFSNEVTQIKKLNPDVILVASSPKQQLTLFTALSNSANRIPIISDQRTELIDLAKDWRAPRPPLVITSSFALNKNSSELTKQFVTEYQNKHQSLPSSITALGFDSYMIARAAIIKAQSTKRSDIRNSLASMKDIPCVSSTVTFQPQKIDPRPLFLKVITNNEFTYLATVLASTPTTTTTTTTAK